MSRRSGSRRYAQSKPATARSVVGEYLDKKCQIYYNVVFTRKYCTLWIIPQAMTPNVELRFAYCRPNTPTIRRCVANTMLLWWWVMALQRNTIVWADKDPCSENSVGRFQRIGRLYHGTTAVNNQVREPILSRLVSTHFASSPQISLDVLSASEQHRRLYLQ